MDELRENGFGTAHCMSNSGAHVLETSRICWRAGRLWASAVTSSAAHVAMA